MQELLKQQAQQRTPAIAYVFYSEGSPTVFNGAFSQEGMHRIVSANQCWNKEADWKRLEVQCYSEQGDSFPLISNTAADAKMGLFGHAPAKSLEQIQAARG